MTDSNQQFRQLYRKWVAGQTNPAEEAQFFALWKDMEKSDVLQELQKEDWLQVEDFVTPSGELKEKIWLSAVGERTATATVHRVHFLRTAWFRYAVAVIVLLGAGIYVWMKDKGALTPLVRAGASHPTSLPPATNGATLTLADGTSIVLDTATGGVLAAQNGSKATLKDGLLVYDKMDQVSAAMAYNTVTTPKGRQFQLVLPDGSKVWMNAGSSLRFPTWFDTRERTVELTGEAYFEVAQQAHAPFKILPGRGAAILVLGTSLNVNAYENEASIGVTLISGRINVSNRKDTIPLIPGQQAMIDQAIDIEKNADLGKVMAWKNGAFDFTGTSLRDAMRQLERWYDIEVVYERGVSDNIPFSGRISRKSTLDNLLKRLEGTALRFRMEEGRRLIIQK